MSELGALISQLGDVAKNSSQSKARPAKISQFSNVKIPQNNQNKDYPSILPNSLPEEQTKLDSLQITFPVFTKQQAFKEANLIKLYKGITIGELAEKASPGTVIEVPEGEYTEEIKLTKNIKIKGIGKVKITGLSKNDTIISEGAFVELENLVLVQKSTNSGGALTVSTGFLRAINCTFICDTISSVSVTGDSKAEFVGCEFSESNNPCLITNESAQVYATKCKFTQSKTFGVYSTDNSVVTLEKSVMNRNESAGISCSGASKALIQECEIKDNVNGADVTSTGIVVFLRSYIKDHKNGTGISAEGNVKPLLIECTLENNAVTSINATGGANIVTKHCIIRESPNNCLVVAQKNATVTMDHDDLSGGCVVAAAAFENGEINATDIFIHDVPKSGIVAYSGGSLVMNGGRIEKVPDVGVQVRDGASFNLQKLTVERCGQQGIALMSSVAGEILESEVTGCACGGIEIHNAGQVSVIACRLLNNTEGIIIRNTPVAAIEDCELLNSVKSEIVISGEETKPKIVKCSFQGAKEALVSISEKSQPFFQDCNFHDAPNIGVATFSSSEPTFNDCIFTKCGTAALSIYGKSTPTFERCKIKENLNFAAQLFESDTSAFFTDSVFENNRYSVSIIAMNETTVFCNTCKFIGSLQPHVEVRNGSIVQLTKCDVSRTIQGVGLQVHAGGILNINDTLIHDEAKMGVLIGDRGTLHLKGGEIKNCGMSGIVCMGNGVLQADKAVFSGNGQFSIQLMEKAEGDIKNCTIENNTMFGILVSKGANIKSTDNKFANNGQNDIMNM